MAEQVEKGTRGLDLGVIGSTGLRHAGGYIFEEFLARLQGRLGALTYREMRDNSSTIGAIAFTIESLIRQVQWRVEPAGDSPEAKDWGEFTDGCLRDMSSTWEDTLCEMLSCLWYGWSYHELVYKMRRGPETTNSKLRSKFDDGRVGWRKMPIRAQDTLLRWEIDLEDNGVVGLHQMDPYSGHGSIFLPIEKSLLFRGGVHKGNPEGRSLLRNAALDYFRHKRICDIEAVGIERDMTGLLTMEVPLNILHPKADADAVAIRSELQRMLSQLKRDEREYAMVPAEMIAGADGKQEPSGYKLKLLASGGRRQIDTNAIVLR